MKAINGIKIANVLAIRKGTLLTFADPGYLDPSAAEVRSMLQQLQLKGREAASICGVNGRTVRKWMTAGGNKMPYGAWRLLVLHAAWTHVKLLTDAGSARFLVDQKELENALNELDTDEKNT